MVQRLAYNDLWSKSGTPSIFVNSLLQLFTWNNQVHSFLYCLSLLPDGASQEALVVRNLPLSAGDLRDPGLIPGLERSPEGGYGHLLQYSCLENPMDRGAWQTTVHRITKSQTQLNQLSTYTRFPAIMGRV